MKARSLNLSSVGKAQVERALNDKQLSVDDLAEEASVSSATAKSFRSGKAVDRKNFVKFCKVLGLDWEIVSDQQSLSIETPSDRPSTPSQQDDWIQQIRDQCRKKILTQHGKMRLLNGREIGVDQLYVDVWLLEQPEHKLNKTPADLLSSFDKENGRLFLSKRIGDRNPGFEVANENPKLMILGKPGAGKTTFLKHLAVDWCKGQFQPELIAVYIEFRQIQDEQWHLLEAIGKELERDNGNQISRLKGQIKTLEQRELPPEKEIERQKQIEEFQHRLSELPLHILLTQSKLLIFMDGLDEVPTVGLRSRVHQQLRAIEKDYPSNRFILTCRTQLEISVLGNFVSVEVADFSPEQAQQFVQNWFEINKKSKEEASEQWEKINNAIKNNSALKELTATPVLLSLMCLVLQHSNKMEIPSDKTYLYKRGIELLLSDWNKDKKIDGWEVGSEAYRKLKAEDKEDLLIKIAVRKFENSNNSVLFDEKEIADQIEEILHLADYGKRSSELRKLRITEDWLR